MSKVFAASKEEILQASDTVLTTLLLAIGAFLVALAFVPEHRLEKAIVLAWVLLP